MIMVLGGSRKKSEKEKGGQWGSVFHNKFGSTELNKSVLTCLHITLAALARRVNACFTKIWRP